MGALNQKLCGNDIFHETIQDVFLSYLLWILVLNAYCLFSCITALVLSHTDKDRWFVFYACSHCWMTAAMLNFRMLKYRSQLLLSLSAIYLQVFWLYRYNKECTNFQKFETLILFVIRCSISSLVDGCTSSFTSFAAFNLNLFSCSKDHKFHQL